MDESLERPNHVSVPAPDNHDNDDAESSGDEDGGPDWTKLSSNAARPVIPKRGEKEFEPAPGGGSGLQLHILDRARFAMFDALKAIRSTSSKSISYGIWHPEIARAHVTVARGIHFSSMGHSVPRPLAPEEKPVTTQKRLELLPEEAIYLIERGAMFCWKERQFPILDASGLDGIEGSPMSVQQAFAEMIGKEGLTLEKYQVFAYLKRLGYTVTRAKPPSVFYPVTPSLVVAPKVSSIALRILSVFPSWFSQISRWFNTGFNWWKPVRIGGWLNDNSYRSIFKSMRFIPSGYDLPLMTAASRQTEQTPYQLFFHLYKPSTPFRKSSPPPPDFSIVVVNARTTNMPSLYELSALFGTQPELPPPLPRPRRQLSVKPTTQPASTTPIAPVLTSASLSITQRFFRVFTLAFWRPSPATPTVRGTNPFMALKAGRRNIIIAVVDSGSISFFRFGQGAFSEWPMV